MKKTLILCALLNSFMRSAQVKFVSNDWNELQKTSKAENKYIYIDAYTDWCYWCKVLDKKTFSDSSIADFMNTRFVCGKMEMQKEEWGKKLAFKYVVSIYPTGLVFNNDGKLVYVITGYAPPADFMKSLENALIKDKQLDLKGFTNHFDIEYPDFYLKAMAENGKQEFPEKKVVNQYLKNQKDKLSETSWVVWKRFDDAVDENNKQFFLTHYSEFKELFGKEDVEDVIGNFIYTMADSAGRTHDQKLFNDAMNLVDKYISDPENQKIQYQASYYKKTGDWKAYDRNIKEQMKKNPDMTGETINQIAWDIYEKCDDATVISDAVSWMKKVVAKEQEYNYLDTYAALLYKAGQYAEAKKYALLAIVTGKAKKIDVKGTEKLLEKINTGK
jgi:thioredoxin-related protein